MAYPFKCEGCGKPRSYINQYCPACESTGPHIPVSSADRKRQFRPRSTPAKQSEPDRQKPPKKKEAFISEEVDVEIITRRTRKPLERPTAVDDRDIRSLYARRPSRRQVNKSVLRNVVAVLAAVIFMIIIAANGNSIAHAIASMDIPGRLSALTRSSPGDNKNESALSNPASTVLADNQSAAKNQEVAKQPAGPSVTEDKNKSSGAADNTSAVAAKPPLPMTGSNSDLTKPRITEGPSASATSSSATIAWKTNVKATSFIRYGNDTSYLFPSIQVDELKTDHSILLEGLAPDSIYHYQTISKDAAGNTLVSDDNTFRTEPISSAAPYMGSKAPNFTLKDLNGEQISLNQYLGKKVILNFWASWCTPCKIELPHLQAVWDKYRDSSSVVLLTVAGSQSDEAVIRDYVTMENKFDFEVCLDSSDFVFNRYQIVSIPKTYFIDKDGIIRKIQQGMFTSPAEVEFMLESYQ